MKKDAEEPRIIDEILHTYEYGYNSLSDYKYEEGHPASIIIVTDSKKDLGLYIG